ncbi:MAG: phenylalanine--tRNA ligase alpha subunit [Cyclobacteriaceae bacterium]|nr:MAG: phenylalanine--tRNA ligase alpha subunit [Cyclobacteriaceae bacterium]
MLDQVKALHQELEKAQVSNQDELESFRLRFISRKGVITELFQGLKQAAPEDRKELGRVLNELKDQAQQKFKNLIHSLEVQAASTSSSDLDLTLPPGGVNLGAVHPLSAIWERVIEIFGRMGFNVSDGPEIEDDWHNFTALNFPPNHPAREMQDTFFIEKDPDIALRTHTSSVQIRVMEKQQPPIRTLSPGRVFRNEAISARAHCIFHQYEILYVDENVGFKDLKQTLFHFAREMFGKNVKIRFRPSYFPFTEPSAEIDISCLICQGEGCNICKYTGWVEVGGSGMVDPNVLENCGIDSNKYTGYAAGLGIERTAMLKYQINDLRLFTQNDIRFLEQFRSLGF